MKISIPPTLWSYISGFLCAVAYFVLIDATVVDQHGKPTPTKETHFLNWLAVIIAIPGFILLNLIPPKNLYQDSGHEHDVRVVTWNRILMFFAFIILFGAVLTGLIIMIVFLTSWNRQNTWLQVATLLHPMFILVSAFTLFLGKLLGHKLVCGED